MKIKLCGFSEEKSLKAAIQSNCDFLGFVFYDQSLRNISIAKAKELFSLIPDSIKKVAVIVDPGVELLNKIADLKPDYIQFHGNESPEFIKNFQHSYPNIKTIKAFRISEKKDLQAIEKYDFVDLFLFDSKVKNEMGGSGQKIDWSILKDFRTNKEWILSGGLNINNIDDAIKETNATFIDISSGIESGKGVKSIQKIEELMHHIKE